MDEQTSEKKPQTHLLRPVEFTETFIMSGNNPLLRKLLDKSPQETTDTVPSREIVLLVRGIPESVKLAEDRPVIVGRVDLTTGYKPNLDLTPYDAHKRGVSRGHVRLHLQDQHLFLTDLASANGTFISGKRLPPNEPVMLRDGDEVVLGGLAVKVLFN
jgi:pSer/pThr/pTyr-binding forkhead associated (FHA) protein